MQYDKYMTIFVSFFFIKLAQNKNVLSREKTILLSNKNITLIRISIRTVKYIIPIGACTI